MTFSEALTEVKALKRIARTGWSGKGMWIALIVPAPFMGYRMRQYLALKTTHDDIVPWCPDSSDLLMDDWYVVEP